MLTSLISRFCRWLGVLLLRAADTLLIEAGPTEPSGPVSPDIDQDILRRDQRYGQPSRGNE